MELGAAARLGADPAFERIRDLEQIKHLKEYRADPALARPRERIPYWPGRLPPAEEGEARGILDLGLRVYGLGRLPQAEEGEARGASVLGFRV